MAKVIETRANTTAKKVVKGQKPNYFEKGMKMADAILFPKQLGTKKLPSWSARAKDILELIAKLKKQRKYASLAGVATSLLGRSMGILQFRNLKMAKAIYGELLNAGLPSLPQGGHTFCHHFFKKESDEERMQVVISFEGTLTDNQAEMLRRRYEKPIALEAVKSLMNSDKGWFELEEELVKIEGAVEALKYLSKGRGHFAQRCADMVHCL